MSWQKNNRNTGVWEIHLYSLIRNIRVSELFALMRKGQGAILSDLVNPHESYWSRMRFWMICSSFLCLANKAQLVRAERCSHVPWRRIPAGHIWGVLVGLLFPLLFPVFVYGVYRCLMMFMDVYGLFPQDPHGTGGLASFNSSIASGWWEFSWTQAEEE